MFIEIESKITKAPHSFNPIKINIKYSFGQPLTIGVRNRHAHPMVSGKKTSKTRDAFARHFSVCEGTFPVFFSSLPFSLQSFSFCCCFFEQKESSNVSICKHDK